MEDETVLAEDEPRTAPLSQADGDADGCVAIVGPISAFWGPPRENTPEHLEFLAHRSRLVDALVDDGHLVYQPFRAFQGRWIERFQRVNDLAIAECALVLDVTPLGPPHPDGRRNTLVPSPGTDRERAHADRCGTPVWDAPPGTNLRVLLERVAVFLPTVPTPGYSKDPDLAEVLRRRSDQRIRDARGTASL